MNVPSGLLGFEQLSLVQRLVTSAVVLLVLTGAAWYVSARTEWELGDSPVRTVLVVAAFGVLATVGAVVLTVVWNVVDPTLKALGAIQVVSKAGVQFVATLTLIAGSYVVTGVLRSLLDRATNGREHVSDHQTEIVYRTIQLTVYTTAAFVALSLWGVDLGGLLVGAGFLGIVVGMAARQTFGAVLAGFVLMFSRPFEIGDWIEIEGEEGIVTDITIVDTRIQTFDGEYVVVPNTTVSGSTLTNLSRKGRLRLHVEVGVDYDTDVDHASDVAVTTMRDLDDVLSVPTPNVVLDRFGDSSVVLGLRFWIDKPTARRKWRARTAVIEAVKRAFEAEGIEIPFPQRELGARDDGFRLSGSDEPLSTVDGGER